MNKQKEMTALVVSVGADTEQPSQICTANSIIENCEDFKTYEQSLKEQFYTLRLKMITADCRKDFTECSGVRDCGK